MQAAPVELAANDRAAADLDKLDELCRQLCPPTPPPMINNQIADRKRGVDERDVECKRARVARGDRLDAIEPPSSSVHTLSARSRSFDPVEGSSSGIRAPTGVQWGYDEDDGGWSILRGEPINMCTVGELLFYLYLLYKYLDLKTFLL